MPRAIDRINKYLDYEFRGVALSASDRFYINLSTTAINLDGTGATLVNLTDGYEEISLEKNINNWTEPINGELTNSIIISFPSGSAVSTGDWGTIMAIVLSDTSRGTPIYFYNLQSSVDVNSGERITFQGGSLKFKRIGKSIEGD